MLALDHLTVIAPSLAEGVAHVRDCLGLEVPFGQRHLYMGTHNHLLQLGAGTYLEIVALDPEGEAPPRARWFGLDDQAAVRADWQAGRRLRGWVARADLDRLGQAELFGRKTALPWVDSTFDFAIPDDGSLPMGGALPSIIDRRGKPRSMATIADLGARLRSFSLSHPRAEELARRYEALGIDRPPAIEQGDELRYRALIDTPAGMRELW